MKISRLLFTLNIVDKVQGRHGGVYIHGYFQM